jgi:hypothetical protein
MSAYDFWEALSIRLSVESMLPLSAHGESHSRCRARAIENMIHARIVPIGLLRELEPPAVCRSCGYTTNLSCESHDC